MGTTATDDELAILFRQAGADSAPAYERVKRVVLDRISSGTWPEGHQLPSENQLVDALGLSRMTINRALRELAADGMVQRLMGVGTFVAPTKATSPLFEVTNIADEIAHRGHRHRTEVVFLRSEVPDPAHQILRETGQKRVFHSLVVHFEDALPIQVEDRFVNPAEAPDYLDQDFTTITPNRYLSDVAPLVRGEHVVEAVNGTEDECSLLQIPKTEPCLLIRRRTWSARSLVSAARLVHPGSRNRLEGSFTV